MMRAILSAILGFVVMAIVVSTGDLVILLVFGNDFFLDTETLTVRTGYCILNLVVGVIAALFGGYLAARLAGVRGRIAARILVSIVMAMGAIFIILAANQTIEPLPSGTTVADLSPDQLVKHVSVPTWYNFAVVVVGMMGVFLGAQYVHRFTGQALDELETIDADNDE